MKIRTIATENGVGVGMFTRRDGEGLDVLPVAGVAGMKELRRACKRSEKKIAPKVGHVTIHLNSAGNGQATIETGIAKRLMGDGATPYAPDAKAVVVVGKTGKRRVLIARPDKEYANTWLVVDGS